jgi:hypothetical protein
MIEFMDKLIEFAFAPNIVNDIYNKLGNIVRDTEAVRPARALPTMHLRMK